MATIYDQHEKAFRRVSAFVIADQGRRVATVALHFPADGAGRLWAYVHWLSLPMVRGYAGGYGYDKRSAAVASAAGRLPDPAGYAASKREPLGSEHTRYAQFQAACRADSGYSWDRELEKAGFQVWQAV